MTGRVFIIGDQDFNLTGNLSSGLIEVINEGKLSMKGIKSNSSKTFLISNTASCFHIFDSIKFFKNIPNY